MKAWAWWSVLALTVGACGEPDCPGWTKGGATDCVVPGGPADSGVGGSSGQGSTSSSTLGTGAPDTSANTDSGVHHDDAGNSSGHGGEGGSLGGEGGSSEHGGVSGNMGMSVGAAGHTSVAGSAEAGAAGMSTASMLGLVCGNGTIDPGELCDSNCPTTCESADKCLASSLVGSASTCDAQCKVTAIETCKSGDGCCPSGCTHASDSDCSAKCGDGVLDPGEKCDPTSSCPTSCDDHDPCTMDMLVGAAAQCSAACTHTPITAAVGGDGCCPNGANANTDSDCPVLCGDGVVEHGEACDGNCPTSCSGGSGCAQMMLVGSASDCSAMCVPVTVTAHVGGDGCCPDGANANTDSDCEPKCGNGVVERGETCDGNCSTSCPSKNGCTAMNPSGSAATCDFSCVPVDIKACTGGDGCCPSGCTNAMDSDCAPRCGDGHIDPGESCDGNCQTNCDDGNPCTTDRLLGSTDKCDVMCAHAPLEAGTSCGSNAVCDIAGQCLQNCMIGSPKCAGQPGTGSCVVGSSWMMCDGGKVCVATWIAAGATCGPGLTCDAQHNCK